MSKEIYLGDWSCKEDMINDYEIKEEELEGIEMTKVFNTHIDLIMTSLIISLLVIFGFIAVDFFNNYKRK